VSIHISSRQPISDRNRPYGFAAARAYSAYGDQYFLDLAKGVWQFGLNWTITDAAIASGRTQGKNYTISTHCGDVEPSEPIHIMLKAKY
jgi:hypothetical protein